MKWMAVLTRNTFIWVALAIGHISLVAILWSLGKPDVEVELLSFEVPYARRAEPPAAGLGRDRGQSVLERQRR